MYPRAYVTIKVQATDTEVWTDDLGDVNDNNGFMASFAKSVLMPAITDLFGTTLDSVEVEVTHELVEPDPAAAA